MFRVKMPNLTRRASIAVAAGAAVVTFVAGCSSTEGTDRDLSKSSIKVGVPASVDAAPVYVGIEHHLFAKEGLQVQAVPVKPEESLKALEDGKVDMVLADYVSLFKEQAEGKDLRILAEGYQAGPGTLEIVVAKDSRISKPADLANATIAVDQRAGFGELLTTASLAASNIRIANPNKSFVTMPFKEMAQALRDGTVQAAWMPEPYVSVAEQGSKEVPGVRRLFDTATGPTEEVPLSGYVASASWTKRHKDVTEAFIAGLTAAKALAVDRTEVEKVLVDNMKVSAQTAALARIGQFPQSVVPDRLQRVANDMTAQGVLPADTSLVVEKYTQL